MTSLEAAETPAAFLLRHGDQSQWSLFTNSLDRLRPIWYCRALDKKGVVHKRLEGIFFGLRVMRVVKVSMEELRLRFYQLYQISSWPYQTSIDLPPCEVCTTQQGANDHCLKNVSPEKPTIVSTLGLKLWSKKFWDSTGTDVDLVDLLQQLLTESPASRLAGSLYKFWNGQWKTSDSFVLESILFPDLPSLSIGQLHLLWQATAQLPQRPHLKHVGWCMKLSTTRSVDFTWFHSGLQVIWKLARAHRVPFGREAKHSLQALDPAGFLRRRGLLGWDCNITQLCHARNIITDRWKY